MDPKKQAAAKAVTLVKNQSVIGLGAGTTMLYMADLLKAEIDKGLHIKLLTSSYETKRFLLNHGLPVGEIKSFTCIDVYFDGCDQFDEDLNALKSGGGIHTHEKLLASMANEFILVGDESKYAERLDTKFPVAIESLAEATNFIISKIKEIFPGVRIKPRTRGLEEEFILTENKNYLVDIWFDQWPVLSTINPTLKTITGVIESSLFYDMVHKAIIAGESGTRIIEKHR
jgi:ribose 5-phosphate isomerase A